MADAMKINPKAKYPDHRGPKAPVRNRSRPEANMADPAVNAMAPTFRSVSARRGMSRKTLRETPIIPPRDRKIVATKVRNAGRKRADGNVDGHLMLAPSRVDRKRASAPTGNNAKAKGHHLYLSLNMRCPIQKI